MANKQAGTKSFLFMKSPLVGTNWKFYYHFMMTILKPPVFDIKGILTQTDQQKTPAHPAPNSVNRRRMDMTMMKLTEQNENQQGKLYNGASKKSILVQKIYNSFV